MLCAVSGDGSESLPALSLLTLTLYQRQWLTDSRRAISTSCQSLLRQSDLLHQKFSCNFSPGQAWRLHNPTTTTSVCRRDMTAQERNRLTFSPPACGSYTELLNLTVPASEPPGRGPSRFLSLRSPVALSGLETASAPQRLVILWCSSTPFLFSFITPSSA